MGYFCPLNVLKNEGSKPSFRIILSVIIAIAQIEHYISWDHGDYMETTCKDWTCRYQAAAKVESALVKDVSAFSSCERYDMKKSQL